MSQRPISLSGDLLTLRMEGFALSVKSGFLFVSNIPYVNSAREIKRGTLVMQLDLTDNIAQKPPDHVAHFIGEHPCDPNGNEIVGIKNSSNRREIVAGVFVDHMFSARADYRDYHHKATSYVARIEGPAQVLNPDVTARGGNVVEPDEDEPSPFHYIDTASARAEIVPISAKLEADKLAIVGLGGSGSYVLDLVAKTPLTEIHLFDGDEFSQHNAFRSPGAPSIEQLREKPRKVDYFATLYSKMHKGIKPHAFYIDQTNVDQLRTFEFIFLCLDKGSAKRLIVDKLEEFGTPFVEVGMGVEAVDGALTGTVRTVYSSAQNRAIRENIPFGEPDAHNDYARNIQIADLNALNATLAVIRWKKTRGFYHDMEKEAFSSYAIAGNRLFNSDTYEN